MKLGGDRSDGPTRATEALADADLARMRAAESRDEVPRVLAELHAEAAAEK